MPDSGPGWTSIYEDGGFDDFYVDGGSADGDGGCHRTSSYVKDASAPGVMYEREELLGTDGGVVEVYSFTDWRNVDGAVQQLGAALVDARLAGPVDSEPILTSVRCGLRD